MNAEECANCPYMETEGLCATGTDNLFAWPSDQQPYCRRQEKWCEAIPHCCVGRDIAATKQKVLDYVSYMEDRMGQPPIYEIVLYSRDGLYNDDLGFPDTGTEDRPAFYYELDTAVRAMHENWGDMHECLFVCGFVYAKFPGTYPDGHTETRIFFRWNDKLQGFYEAEEPKNWEHSSL